MNNNKNNNSAIDENGLNYHQSKQAVGPFTVAVPAIDVKMHRSDKLNRKMLCQMQENSVLFLLQWSYCISQHNIFWNSDVLNYVVFVVNNVQIL